jgi:hypothetical protein
VSGVYHTLTLHRDGSSWSVIPSPNPGTGSRYPQGALLRTGWAAAPNDVWAVGRDYNGSSFRTLALHWEGSTWTVGYSFNTDAAIDQTLAERWNGSRWRVVSTPNAGDGGSYLKGLAAISSSNVWADGYSIALGLYRTLVEHWNGTSWSVVPSPNA